MKRYFIGIREIKGLKEYLQQYNPRFLIQVTEGVIGTEILITDADLIALKLRYEITCIMDV